MYIPGVLGSSLSFSMLIFLQANESLIARWFPPCLFNELFGYQKSIKLWSTFPSLSTHFFSSTQTSMKKKEKKADSRFVTHKALIHHAHIFTQLNTKLWWWREEIFLFSTRAPLKGKNFFLLRTYVSIPSFILFGMRVRKWSLAKRCIFLAITELQFYGLLTTIQHVKRTWGNWKPINASSSCSKIRVSSNREGLSTRVYLCVIEYFWICLRILDKKYFKCDFFFQ